MEHRAMQITFIGLGKMGRAMASRLLQAGFDLTVWNRTASHADELAAAGARHATTLTDAVNADVVITMVADDAALEDIAFAGGLIRGLRAGSIHVSMSTISVALAERLDDLHAQGSGRFVSAPVFGRPD